MSKERYPIKATSHIINLLGDELIGSDSLAIFELVKNAYDADATKVTITFNDLDSPNRNIVIQKLCYLCSCPAVAGACLLYAFGVRYQWS